MASEDVDTAIIVNTIASVQKIARMFVGRQNMNMTDKSIAKANETAFIMNKRPSLLAYHGENA
jgi:hypothetical protein